MMMAPDSEPDNVSASSDSEDASETASECTALAAELAALEAELEEYLEENPVELESLLGKDSSAGLLTAAAVHNDVAGDGSPQFVVARCPMDCRACQGRFGKAIGRSRDGLGADGTQTESASQDVY